MAVRRGRGSLVNPEPDTGFSASKLSQRSSLRQRQTSPGFISHGMGGEGEYKYGIK
ncbi:hypothetical protein K0M31_007426 [Melipona bicolor]|uniref:Uncharacterized protein n=1 Tax=Melipona bicolor TaxID=60889 RepID=A0AA40GCT1_9HYME|nr:hypothetical protein K0M31_007426 [Melipona bicolor]